MSTTEFSHSDFINRTTVYLDGKVHSDLVPIIMGYLPARPFRLLIEHIKYLAGESPPHKLAHTKRAWYLWPEDIRQEFIWNKNIMCAHLFRELVVTKIPGSFIPQSLNLHIDSPIPEVLFTKYFDTWDAIFYNHYSVLPSEPEYASDSELEFSEPECSEPECSGDDE